MTSLVKRLFSPIWRSWVERLSGHDRPFPACGPPGMRIYAVGDVHGRADLLERILVALLADAREAMDRGVRPVAVFLGDYIDRGPQSRQVLQRLSHLPVGLVEWHFLEGNHEAAMQAFLYAPSRNPLWLRFGGLETLASYGIFPPATKDSFWPCRAAGALQDGLPKAQSDFIEALEPRLVLGDYIFVHAGLRPRVSISAQSHDDLLWIREPFLSSRRRHDKRVVHGHTRVDHPLLRPERIAIDTGAYDTGRLTCLVLQEETVRLFSTEPETTGVTWWDVTAKGEIVPSRRGASDEIG